MSEPEPKKLSVHIADSFSLGFGLGCGGILGMWVALLLIGQLMGRSGWRVDPSSWFQSPPPKPPAIEQPQ